MKNLSLLVLLAAALFFVVPKFVRPGGSAENSEASIAAASTPIAPSPVVHPIVSPTPPPAPTPNPAHGAIQAIVGMYPDLAKKGSTFNLMFLDEVEEMKRTEAETLARPDWPFTAADRVASRLGVSAIRGTPTPEQAPIAVRAPLERYVSPLDAPAYNQRRVVPVFFYDQYRQRYYLSSSGRRIYY